MRLLAHTTFLVAALCSPSVWGDWICTETSSQSQGDSILACGIGESKSLQGARDQSREAAFKEFDDLCTRSSSCAPYLVEVEPRRTECRGDGKSTFRCTRAVLFRITSKRKKDQLVDVEDVRIAISDEKARLNKLRERYSALKKLSQKQAEAKRLERKLSESEYREIQLKKIISQTAIARREYKYQHLLFAHSLKLDLTLNPLALDSQLEGQVELGVAYEYRLWSALGVGIRYGIGTNILQDAIRSQSDIPTTGNPNTSVQATGQLLYHDLAAALVYYPDIWWFYSRLSVGMSVGSYEMFSITYGPLGTPTDSSVTNINVSQEYLSLSFGVDTRDDRKGGGFFVDIGARQRVSGGSPALGVTGGVSFGF